MPPFLGGPPTMPTMSPAPAQDALAGRLQRMAPPTSKVEPTLGRPMTIPTKAAMDSAPLPGNSPMMGGAPLPGNSPMMGGSPKPGLDHVLADQLALRQGADTQSPPTPRYGAVVGRPDVQREFTKPMDLQAQMRSQLGARTGGAAGNFASMMAARPPAPAPAAMPAVQDAMSRFRAGGIGGPMQRSPSPAPQIGNIMSGLAGKI